MRFPALAIAMRSLAVTNAGAMSDTFFQKMDWLLPSQGDWPDAAAHATLMDGCRATAMVNSCSEERMDCELLRKTAAL